jgi:hypothetical protein
LAFVLADHFNIKFSIPLSSLPGVEISTQLSFDGTFVEGVFMQLTEDFPADLPYALAEISSEREILYANYVHDKDDLHTAHGEKIFNTVLAGTMARKPQALRSPKAIAKVGTWNEFRSKVQTLLDERRAAAQAFVPGAAPAAVVVNRSRLDAAISGPAVPAPKAKAKAAGAPTKGKGKGFGKVLRQKTSGYPACPTGWPAAAPSSVSVAPSLVDGRAPSIAPSMSFEPPGHDVGSPSLASNNQSPFKGSASQASFGGGRGSSTAPAASSSDPLGEVKLGGYRGMSQVITIVDIFNGNNPGREIYAVARYTKSVHTSTCQSKFPIRHRPH